MLRLVPSARYAIGVHIGIGSYRIAITNLFAEIVERKIGRFKLETPPEVVIESMIQCVNQTIEAAKIERGKIIGVGVGASGLVNYERGINVFAPRLGWENVPIQQLMENQLNLPVCVDNNVRAMALAEALFGDGRGASVLAFVYGRVGVGSGIVVNGQVFRGSGAGAGEIGPRVVCDSQGGPDRRFSSRCPGRGPAGRRGRCGGRPARGGHGSRRDAGRTGRFRRAMT
jgi:predicted NBD/HSP70 family sugar kinase